MFGDSDPLFPDNINRKTYEPLQNAMEGTGKLATVEVSGRGHTVEDSDFEPLVEWLACAKERSGPCAAS